MRGGFLAFVLATFLHASANAQTLHNEPHKAYGQALNSADTKHCFGADIDYERSGQYAQSGGTVVPPTIHAVCTQPASEFIAAFNYAGYTKEQDGVQYLRYVYGDALEGDTIEDTWLNFTGDLDLLVVTPPGKYRIVAHQKPSECGGWRFEVGDVAVVGEISEQNKRHDIVVSFDQWRSQAVFTHNQCSARIYAVEFYRLR